MQKKDQPKPSMDKDHRRRGRPAGKNRVPLSLAERRARNAQYERERRNETAEAMAQLAEAACCDPQITNSELLATVISQLQRASTQSPETIEDLIRINDSLESQIAVLQSRLEESSGLQEQKLSTDSDGRASSLAESGSEACRSDERPLKYRKTKKEDTVHTNAEISEITSSLQPDSSTDSRDSVWSNHYLGKTLPQQEPHPTPADNTDVEHTTSSSHTRTESASSEWRRESSPENESHSESSNQYEAYSEQPETHQDVKVDFQLVPNRDLNSERSVDERSNVSFADPFTDREKDILERMGCSDFINYQDFCCEDQAQLVWPLDYNGYQL